MFPNDADGQVLKSLKKEGIDFSKRHDVDFHITIEHDTDNFEPNIYLL